MTRPPLKTNQTIRIPPDKSRKLACGPKTHRDTNVTATLRKNSKLEITDHAPALHLIYADANAGGAYIAVAANATVWIESWHAKSATGTLTIELAPGASVGLSERAMAAAQPDGFHVVFNSDGTGYLTATWDASRDTPALQVSGAQPGDRMDISVIDSAGTLCSLDRALDRAPRAAKLGASVPHETLSRWLPGLDTATLAFTDEACAYLPMPIGVDQENWQALHPLCGAGTQENGDGPALHGDTAQADLRVTTHTRASMTAEQWKRYAPVVFEPDALAPGVPEKRVVLAPGQGIRYGGTIVAAHALVNGRRITRDETGHCLVYISPFSLLAGDFSLAGIDLVTDRESEGTSSSSVEQCRQRALAHAAAQDDITLVDQPALRLEFDGLVIDGVAPRTPVGVWRFTLPTTLPASELRIVSRSAVARETSPVPLADDRVLGVALAALVVLGPQGPVTVDLSHPDWMGLHNREYRRGTAIRWTNGLASIGQHVHLLRGGETIELHVAAVSRYWVTNDLLIDDHGTST